jgi:hypothetical protein
VTALGLLSAFVLEDGRRWGDAAVDVQRADAAAILVVDSATPYHFLTRSRGYSKTTDLAGIAVAAMLTQLPSRSRLYALAADVDQGRLLIDSIAGFAARTPELAGALQVDAYRVTATRAGSVLDVLASDAPSSWGLRPGLLIVDELTQWAATQGAQTVWESVMSSAAKAACRVACISTSGDPAHWSRKVLDHALADPLWRVHEVPGPPPWLDPERLAEQERRLPPSRYARLFRNEWVSGEDRLVSDDDLAACVTLLGPQPPQPNIGYVIGVDVGLKRDRSVCAITHAVPVLDDDAERAVGVRVVLDRMQVWQGSSRMPVLLAEIEEWLLHATATYNRASVVLDPWQAVGMMQRLASAGVRVAEYPFTAQSVGRLANTLYGLLHDRLLDLPDDADLLDELAAVRLRETSPGVVRIDHDSGRNDDRVIAIGLAAQQLIEGRIGPPAEASSGTVGESLIGPAFEDAYAGLGGLGSLDGLDRF